MNKKAFTLFEILIVVILFSIVLGFALTSFNFNTTAQNKITLNNLKQSLLQKEFSKSISIKCSNDVEYCFLYIDNTLQEDTIKLTNSTQLETYEYDNTNTQITFKDIEPKELESYNVNFEITIDKDSKHTDMIIFDQNKYYIFNNIKMKPTVLDSLSDIDDYFYDLKKEVKDNAF